MKLVSRVWQDPQRWLVLLLAIYLAARIAVLAGAEIFTSFDSFSYAYRGDPFYDRGPLVSFTGHAPRLWGVPLFYAAFPDDWWRALGQWVLGTVAWASLATVLWTLMRHTAAKVLAASAVLLLALLNYVSNLDFAILSESLTVSLGVIVLAGLLRWLATGSTTALVITTVAGFWWTFTRPDTRVFTVVVIVVLVACAWRLRPRRLPAAVAAGVLLVAVGWCSAITPNMTEAFKTWGAVNATQDEELWLYRLRNDVYPRPEIKAVFVEEFGMPDCPGAERSAARVEWDIIEFAEEYRACPEMVAWGEAHMGDAFTRLPLAAPGPYLSMSYDLAGHTLSGGTYGPVRTIVPGIVHRVAFPGHPWAVPFTVVVVAVGIGLALLAGAFRRRRLVSWSATITAVVCLGSAVVVVAMVGGQLWRFGVQEVLGVRVAVIMLVAAALDTWLERRRPPGEVTPTSAATPGRAPTAA